MAFFRKKTELTDISGIKAKRIITQVPLGQHYLLGMDNWVGNSRILVVGNPENGKTHNVIAGALLQGDKSYIVNDLNGELYEMCGPALEKMGYKVYQFNFNEGIESIPKVDYAELLNKKVVVFIKAEKVNTKLLAKFYTQSYWKITEIHKQDGEIVAARNSSKEHPVMCLLDNFTDIGKIEELPYLLGSNRGNGLCFMISVRSLSQLKKVYSDDWSLETILGSCWTKIYLYGSGEEMKKHYSYEKIPIPQNPGDEVILYCGKEPLRDKVYDIDKRLEELK